MTAWEALAALIGSAVGIALALGFLPHTDDRLRLLVVAFTATCVAVLVSCMTQPEPMPRCVDFI
jgi:hypothetical protein